MIDDTLRLKTNHHPDIGNLRQLLKQVMNDRPSRNLDKTFWHIEAKARPASCSAYDNSLGNHSDIPYKRLFFSRCIVP